MEEAVAIVKSIQNGDVKPFYFLMGEEPYYIDKIADYIESNLLKDEEKGFNQLILYGRDTTIDDIASNAKRYPMMAQRQVIIVKEAQDLSKTIENLEAYINNPQPTTTLVLCYKYKKIDKRKKLYQAIKKAGVVYESKKIYEDKVAGWIQKTMKSRNYAISPKASQMLAEFLGNDLGKIDNELEKLQIIVPEGTEITPELIEENIGISKDFNNFELSNAVGGKDILKAHRIVNYFAQNPKDNPLVVTVAMLFSFFSKLMIYHGITDKSKGNVAKNLKVHPYFVNDYVTGARNYPMKKVSSIFTLLRDADVKGKGVGAYNIPQGDILKELLVKIMR